MMSMKKLDKAYRVFLSVLLGLLTFIGVMPVLFIVIVVIWAVLSV